MLHQNRKQCIKSIRQELKVQEHNQKHTKFTKSVKHYYLKPYDEEFLLTAATLKPNNYKAITLNCYSSSLHHLRPALVLN